MQSTVIRSLDMPQRLCTEFQTFTPPAMDWREMSNDNRRRKRGTASDHKTAGGREISSRRPGAYKQRREVFYNNGFLIALLTNLRLLVWATTNRSLSPALAAVTILDGVGALDPSRKMYVHPCASTVPAAPPSDDDDAEEGNGGIASCQCEPSQRNPEGRSPPTMASVCQPSAEIEFEPGLLIPVESEAAAPPLLLLKDGREGLVEPPLAPPPLALEESAPPPAAVVPVPIT